VVGFFVRVKNGVLIFVVIGIWSIFLNKQNFKIKLFYAKKVENSWSKNNLNKQNLLKFKDPL
jgi:hypothetical protein